MDLSKYEFQSDFAKHYIALGREEGRTEGRIEERAAVLLRLLTLRFGPLSEDIGARIRRASIDELDLITERLLTAPTLDGALGAHGIDAQ